MPPTTAVTNAHTKATSTQASVSSFQNPFAGHRQLNEKEQEVLGEYARLAATVRRVAALSSSLASNERHGQLLSDLRILERKMGLVLTLFKASVWSLIQTHQDDIEQEADEDR
jgi:DASH complex subunit DAD3